MGSQNSRLAAVSQALQPGDNAVSQILALVSNDRVATDELYFSTKSKPSTARVMINSYIDRNMSLETSVPSRALKRSQVGTKHFLGEFISSQNHI